jgi:hypothetical protein
MHAPSPTYAPHLADAIMHHPLLMLCRVGPWEGLEFTHQLDPNQDMRADTQLLPELQEQVAGRDSTD